MISDQVSKRYDRQQYAQAQVEHKIAHVEQGGLSQRPKVSAVQDEQQKRKNVYPGRVHDG
jgi:hypothetical protein